MCACVVRGGGGGDGQFRDSVSYCTSHTVLLVFICNDKHISMHVSVPFAGTV